MTAARPFPPPGRSSSNAGDPAARTLALRPGRSAAAGGPADRAVLAAGRAARPAHLRRPCRTAPDPVPAHLVHAPAALDAVEAGHDRGPGLRGGRGGPGRGGT